ncbi:MAG: hypothetical protein ACE37F_11355 [Nannocystaceae bacterium]|nr:hypothetical protein [bacterium]
MSQDSECTLTYEVIARAGYIFVPQAGYASCEAKVRRMQAEIEAALRSASSTKVVFDNRDTEAPAPWIRAMMWSWLGNHPDLTRVALIQGSDESRRRTQDRATRAWRGISMSWVGRIQIMAFLSEHDAGEWIRSGHLARPA